MTNAEKYKTVDERTKAFRKFCRKHKCEFGKMGEMINSDCPLDNAFVCKCRFQWLTLEAEEEGGEKHD